MNMSLKYLFTSISWFSFGVLEPFFFIKISNISLALKGLGVLCTVPVVPHRCNAADATALPL